MFWRRRDDHPRVDDLSAYLDGELRGRRQGEVAAHLDACEWCRVLFEELRGAKTALADLPRVAAPRSFRLGWEMAGERRVEPLPRRALAYAPAVALTLFVALLAVDLGAFSGGAGDGGLSLTGRTEDSANEKAAGAPQPTDLESALAPSATPAPSTPRDALPLAPEPAAGAFEGDTVHRIGEEGGPDWLRLAELAAGAGFVASVAALLWPRIRGGTRR